MGEDQAAPLITEVFLLFLIQSVSLDFLQISFLAIFSLSGFAENTSHKPY